MKNGKHELIGSLIIIVLGAVFFIGSFQIKAFSGLGATAITSATFPRIWSVILIVLGVYVAMRNCIKIAKDKVKTKVVVKTPFGARLRQFWNKNYEVILTLVAFTLYLVLMQTLGFLLATMLYLEAQILILQNPKKRNYVIPTILAVVASASIYYIFRYQLEVVLPMGILHF